MISAAVAAVAVAVISAATTDQAAGEQDRAQRADEYGRGVGETEVDRAVRVEHEQYAEHEHGDTRQQDRDAARAHHRMLSTEGAVPTERVVPTEGAVPTGRAFARRAPSG